MANKTTSGSRRQRSTLPARQSTEETEAMVDIDAVEGRIKARLAKKAGYLVDSKPEEAVRVIREWLYHG